jgi:glutamyl-tRNA synthetase
MGTTHAIRGEEWVNSTNIHLDLFNTFGWTPPSYGHFPVITKIEEGKKRKLSKRKDPEAAVTWYNEEGYPEEAVLEYLLNLANSSFEDWKKSNSDKTLWEFNFKLDKVGSNSPLFDIVKLNNISKNYIGSMDVNTLLHRILDYSKVYDKDTLELLSNNSTVYNKSVLAIRHLGAQVRKDITKYSDYKVVYNYFYNEPVVDIEELSKNILSSEFLYKYFEYFDKVNPHSKEEWFNMMKDIASSMGCATDIKEYKANPDKYRGSVADLSVILRLVITGNKISPDLWDINTVLTRDVFIGRIKKYINLLKKQYTLSA